MKTKYFISIILILALLPPLASCTGSGGANMAELTIVKQELTKNQSGGTVVKVTVKNTGRAVAEFAEVAVTFYDAGKSVISSARDSVLNLGIGESWDFEIACKGERCGDVRSYDIKAAAGSSKGGL